MAFTGHPSMQWSDILHPDDLGPVLNAYKGACQAQCSFAVEGRIRRFDGEYRWFLITGIAVSEGYSGTCVELASNNETQQMEAALRQSEARYQTLFNSMEEGFGLAKIIVDEDGTPIDLQYLDVNPAFERLTGLSAHDVLTKTVRHIFPQMAQIWIDTYGGVALTGQPIRFQRYANALDLWVEVFAYQTAPGEFAHIFIDITENKRIEEALRISEERLRVAQNLSLDAFTILESVRDERGKVIDFRWVYTNPVACQILKHHADELIGQRLLDLLPGNRSTLFPLYVHVVETGEPHDLEIPYESEGIQGWFRNMTVRLGDDRIAVSFSDISQRKRSELHLRQLEEIASRLLTAITPKQVTETILESGSKVLGSAGGAIALLDKSGKNLELIASVGYPPELIEAWRSFPVDLPNAPLADAVRKKNPVFVRSPQERKNIRRNRPRDTVNSAWAALPLIVDGRVLGGLGFSFPSERMFEAAERRFMLTLADYCALALERAQLAEQTKEAAAMSERQRLARDLHDAVSQVLFSSTTIAESLPRHWKNQGDPQKALERLEQVVTLNRAAMAEMRILLLELRPEVMDKTELKTLLKHLIEAAQGRKRIQVDFAVEGPDVELPRDTHIAFYRIAQESIHNVLKHSQATELSAHLAQQENRVVLTVNDNGEGFDPNQSFAGLGLVSMRERAAAVGGTLEILSEPGCGTRIRAIWQRL
jgi:PAS domain S-box-containing protein